MVANIPVFDIDTHYSEPPDLWTSRAPAKYKDKTLHVRMNDKTGRQAWFIEDRQVNIIGPCVIDADMTKHMGSVGMPTFDQMARASYDAKDRLTFMDSYGCGTQIVYPNVIGFGAQQLMKWSDDVDLRLWHIQAYNDALIDLQKGGQGRLLPQAALPLWDIEASLKELDRIRKIGLTGVVMSDSPGDFGQPALSHPVWEPFFTKCQDLGLPINFHIGSGSFEGDLRKWWSDERSFIRADGTLDGELVAFTGVQAFFNNAADIMNLVLHGILEKYPRLKFVSVESGCGWVPFAILGLEYNWREMRPGGKLKFKRTPTEMFMDQVYTSYWFEDRDCVDLYIKKFGSTNLMFETDFPHPQSLYPDIQGKIEETLGHHSRETQENVLYRNAERVYGVPVYKRNAH